MLAFSPAGHPFGTGDCYPILLNTHTHALLFMHVLQEAVTGECAAGNAEFAAAIKSATPMGWIFKVRRASPGGYGRVLPYLSKCLGFYPNLMCPQMETQIDLEVGCPQYRNSVISRGPCHTSRWHYAKCFPACSNDRSGGLWLPNDVGHGSHIVRECQLGRSPNVEHQPTTVRPAPNAGNMRSPRYPKTLSPKHSKPQTFG
jgi:hypothetical protein